MANPTTNYGWPMPTSTDLVTDLPADFAAFGQPVDTTLKALNPETTLGDISYRSATSNTNTRLGIGTNGQVLAVSGGVPAWTTTSDVTPLTTKGDLFTFDTADARLAVGTNGQTLVADSSTATGLKWAAASAGALTLVKAETAFSAVANTGTTFDGVFSSTYNNYLIIINNVLGSIGGEFIQYQMRYAGPTTDSQAANTGGTYAKNSSGTDQSWYFNNATIMKLLDYQSASNRFGNCNLWIGGLNSGSASRYQMNWQFSSAGGNSFGTGGNFQNSNGTERIWTGFILTATSGTISGTVTVYGFGKA